MTTMNLLLVLLSLQLYLMQSLEVISPATVAGVFSHIDAHFGPKMREIFDPNTAHNLVAASPDLGACSPLSSSDVAGKIVLILRGSSFINGTSIKPKSAAEGDGHCNFVDKALAAQRANASGVVIGNNRGSHEIMPMYNAEDIQPDIPSISVSHATFYALYQQMQSGQSIYVRMNEKGRIADRAVSSFDERWITGIVSVCIMMTVISILVAVMVSVQICIQRFRESLRERTRRRRINDSIPYIRYSSQRLISNHHVIMISEGTDSLLPATNELKLGSDERTDCMLSDGERRELVSSESSNSVHEEVDRQLHNETCCVCLEDFVDGEEVRLLRCKHGFHDKCIREWVIAKGKCPICKQNAFNGD